MNKKVFKGWVGKANDSVCGWASHGYNGEFFELMLDGIVPKRGERCHWSPGNWPPKRVKVTVEVLDETGV